jgi:Ca-activated chloride channel family protein
VTLRGALDRTRVLRGGDGLVKMELSLAAAETAGARPRTPADLIVVLDRSGSMEGPKIEAARAALHELVEQLGPGDRMALVAFSSGAEVLIPPVAVSPETKAAWRRTAAGISAGGGTNMSGGLDLALELAARLSAAGGRAGRMLLISDGAANEGDSTPEGLTARARRAARLEYAVSSIGVGEQFNEYLMAALADAGTGNYYYLADTAQLAEVFANEFAATRETVARAVAVEIAPAPGVEVVDAAGYPLERTAGAVTFRPGTLFAGQERRIWVTLRLPDAEAGEQRLGTVQATYRHGDVERSLALPETPKVARVEDREAWVAGFDKASWERAVVEEDYGSLRVKVAGHVKSGRREEALEEIRAYEAMNRELNRDFDSAAVASNLEQVEKLEAEVKDAFVGDEALRLQKQNVLSKTHQALSLDDRRTGAKKKVN